MNLNSTNEYSDSDNCKSTPPTDSKVHNPFEKALIANLHEPICSPGMCKISTNKDSSFFDIDVECTLMPTEIIACNSQFEPSPDPMMEKIAEEATEKFFSKEMVLPSPCSESSNTEPLLLQTTINSSTDFIEPVVPMKDASAQTVLTLPPDLPSEIEKILEQFCTFTQEQNISGEYENTANGSLWRKPFFEDSGKTDFCENITCLGKYLLKLYSYNVMLELPSSHLFIIQQKTPLSAARLNTLKQAVKVQLLHDKLPTTILQASN